MGVFNGGVFLILTNKINEIHKNFFDFALWAREETNKNQFPKPTDIVTSTTLDEAQTNQVATNYTLSYLNKDRLFIYFVGQGLFSFNICGGLFW